MVKKEENNNNTMIIAIVAIVAIVAMVFMMMSMNANTVPNQSGTVAVVDEEGNLIGQASAIDTIDKDYKPTPIPDYLKDYANLDKKVAILGLSNKIELWDEETWKEYKKENSVEDIAQGLEDLDI